MAPRIPEPSLNEKQFLLKALQERLRVDGRDLHDYRKIDLSFGTEYGSADISLGKTRILIRISSEVVSPLPDRPFDGLFTITSEFSPMASPSFSTSIPTEPEILLSRLLEKTIRRSQALDTESLCLIAAQKCWSIRADVHVLSHDGNLVDAACMGVMAALLHFRKPDTSIEGEVVTVYTPAEREPVPLSLLHIPLCITFNLYTMPQSEGGEKQFFSILDATLKEEQIREGSMTIGMNRHGEICQIAKLGGVSVDALELIGLSKVALGKVGELEKEVLRVLDEDLKRRDREGRAAELSAENERVVG